MCLGMNKNLSMNLYLKKSNFYENRRTYGWLINLKKKIWCVKKIKMTYLITIVINQTVDTYNLIVLTHTYLFCRKSSVYYPFKTIKEFSRRLQILIWWYAYCSLYTSLHIKKNPVLANVFLAEDKQFVHFPGKTSTDP